MAPWPLANATWTCFKRVCPFPPWRCPKALRMDTERQANTQTDRQGNCNTVISTIMTINTNSNLVRGDFRRPWSHLQYYSTYTHFHCSFLFLLRGQLICPTSCSSVTLSNVSVTFRQGGEVHCLVSGHKCTTNAKMYQRNCVRVRAL